MASYVVRNPVSLKRLVYIETEYFGWNHAQATSWLLHYWEFPEELVCVAGAHETIATTVAIPTARIHR